MPMMDAIRLLRDVSADADLRCALNTPDSEISFREYVKNIGYDFTEHELEDAERSLVLRCAYENQADEIRETALWLKLLWRGI